MYREYMQIENDFCDKALQCPLCNQSYQNYDSFMGHISTCPNASTSKNLKVVCPICVARPGGNSNYKSINFVGHLQMRH